MAKVRAVGNCRRARGGSPDSVILMLDSNFSSLFSSASASVDRCSFASDALDNGSPSSAELSQHLGGRGSLSGPDLDIPHSNKTAVRSNSSSFSQKVENDKVHREVDYKILYDDHHGEFQPLESSRSSFSAAFKECQGRRSRSEALTKNLEHRRPFSIDLNNPAANVLSFSPRLAVMTNSTISSRKSGNCPSPGTPSYWHGSVGGGNKGWSSERVPLPMNANRRAVGAALLPLNNGRALPSKWEDAERWICSPVAGEGDGRVSSCQQQSQRRPKSKSGPLGLPGVAYRSMYSPVVPMYGGGNLSCHMAGSPSPAGVIMVDGLPFRSGCGGAITSSPSGMEPCIARSVSMHGCTDLVCQVSLTSSQGERVDEMKDAATNVSCAVSRRDIATQMSPEASCHSSPRRSSFSPSTPSVLPIVDVQSFSSLKSEVRDVQIDERVTVTRWSKKYRGSMTGKGSEDVDAWKLKSVEPCCSTPDMADTVKSVLKARGEKSKINTWENLQKAKAEAAIRKLEMTLEKKRLSSMEKIMKKLRSAQMQAQEMRSAVLANQAIQVSPTSNSVSFHKAYKMGCLSGCFTCHAS